MEKRAMKTFVVLCVTNNIETNFKKAGWDYTDREEITSEVNKKSQEEDDYSWDGQILFYKDEANKTNLVVQIIGWE